MQQADTVRRIAQLATQKLGGAARDKLAACTDRLAHDLSNADKQAHVAAKACSYAGSEAVWDEREYRPMCRCRTAHDGTPARRPACPTRTPGGAGRLLALPEHGSALERREGRCGLQLQERLAAEPGGPNLRTRTATRPWPPSNAPVPTPAPTGCSAGAAACGCAEGYKEDPTGGCEVDRAMRLAQTDCSRFAKHRTLSGTTSSSAALRLRCAATSSAPSAGCASRCARAGAAVDCSRFANAEPYWDGKPPARQLPLPRRP